MTAFKILKFIVILSLYIVSSQFCFSQSKKVPYPKEIEYKGSLYQYDPYWSDEDQYLSANLDDDKEDEVILAFGAKHNKKTGYFWQIYDFTGQEYRLIKTTWANDYHSKFLLADLDLDGIKEIIIYSNSGVYTNNIYLYRWLDAGYKLLFHYSTVYGIFVDITKDPPMITVEVPNWDRMKEPDPAVGWHYMAKPLLHVYLWDGKTFAYEEALSSAESTYDIHTIKKARLFSRALFDDSSPLGKGALKDEKAEHLIILLDNRRYYFIYPADSEYFDQIKLKVGSGSLVRMEYIDGIKFKFRLLYDQEVEFIAKHDESLDGVKPALIMK